LLPYEGDKINDDLMNWQYLDMQMKAFSAQLTSAIKLTPEMAEKLATNIAADIRFLSPEQKDEIIASSPIKPSERIVELKAFQGWMDIAHTIKSNPYVTRAQVITQNYICFIYLRESCFRILAKVCPSGSAAKKCAQFLCNNPVRAFRNAIAHANWMYREDFEAIIYWARKGSDPNEPVKKFEVEQNDLAFWQALSRCVGYVAYSNM